MRLADVLADLHPERNEEERRATRSRAHAPVAVVEGEGGGEAGGGNAGEGAESDHAAPASRALAQLVGEPGVKHEVGQVGVLVVRLLDVAQEHAADDAASAPHERDIAVLQVPLVLHGSLLQQHEALHGKGDRRNQRAIATTALPARTK